MSGASGKREALAGPSHFSEEGSKCPDVLQGCKASGSQSLDWNTDVLIFPLEF